MGTFDSVLNWLIPVGVVFIFIALLYSKMKTPIGQFFRWIWRGIQWMTDRGREKTAQTYEVAYRYE